MTRSARVPASSVGPADQDREKSLDYDAQRPAGRKLVPWRPIGTAATSVGAPVGLGLLHPALGAAVFLTEVAVGLIILGTALFGAKEYSERAFRLLRWIGDRPEPDAPPATSTAQLITLSAAPEPRENEPPRQVKAEIVATNSMAAGADTAEASTDADAQARYRLTAGT